MFMETNAEKLPSAMRPNIAVLPVRFRGTFWLMISMARETKKHHHIRRNNPGYFSP